MRIFTQARFEKRDIARQCTQMLIDNLSEAIYVVGSKNTTESKAFVSLEINAFS